jgi:hypothetical protein
MKYSDLLPSEEDHARLLQRAIKHLEQLRTTSTGSQWIVAQEGGDAPYSNVTPGRGGVILWGDYADGRDTQLVVALHRTIDAQIDILKRALTWVAEESMAYIGPEEIKLAKAILGEA